MGDYISRQEMLDAVEKLNIIPSIDGIGKPTPTEDFRVQFLGTVLHVPSADVEPVAYGRWVYVDDDDMRYDTYYCSECRNRITVDSHRRDDIGFTIDDMKRCNKCGAIMDAKEKG